MKMFPRKGIIAGGSWIVDQIKVIDKYPNEESLVSIQEEYISNGGSAYNILVDLVKLGATFPLDAIGLIGNDFNGRGILDYCTEMGIGTQQLRMTEDAPTSYTVVASVQGSGRRTFFHHRGANSLLDLEHFDFSFSNARIFHLGYLLLLDRLDEKQPNGRTKAAEVLNRAKQQGLLTSIDLVSEDSERFVNIIPTALPFVDYFFLNEYEADRLSGINLKNCESHDEMKKKITKVFKLIFDMGVNEWIVIHYPDGVWAAHRNGKRVYQPSLNLPFEYIVGANGAGDAIAAGVLFGIHEGWNVEKCLELGVCAAAASLSQATCSDGILPHNSSLNLAKQFGFRAIG